MAIIKENNPYMEFPLQIKRQYAGSIDSNENWYDLEQLKNYAKTGPTAYAGQIVKYINKADHNKITVYKIEANGELTELGNAKHVHVPGEVIETEDKKFVSNAEKERWNNTYTKPEVDKKITDAIGGLTFKGTFNTIANLPSSEEAKDGWFAIVVNEPTAKGKNVLVIYESADQRWKQLNELVVPGVVTTDLDGLMSKEMLKQLNQLGIDMNAVKDGSLLPKASLSQIGAVKIGDNIQVSEDGTISTHAPYVHPSNHAAAIIVEDETHRFVTDSEKAVYSDKYTKTETDNAIKVVSDKLDESVATLQQQIEAVDAKFVSATDEEIDNLFKVM